MPKTIFVGNLSWDVTSEALLQAFQSFGEISEGKVVTDRNSGRSRGFGFVTFVDPGSADRAIQEMDGKELLGRPIRVREAYEKTEQVPGDRPRRRSSHRHR
jgi:RNA recognition motif-containing protein